MAERGKKATYPLTTEVYGLEVSVWFEGIDEDTAWAIVRAWLNRGAE